MAKNNGKRKASRKGSKAANAAVRADTVARYGNTARNGGHRVWTAKCGKATASKSACRGKVRDW